MPNILLVMLGGALGSAARYLVGRTVMIPGGFAFPWSTLIVNVIGGFLMGLLSATLARFGAGSEPWRVLFGVGVLGGFTTFSAFSLETFTMIERGDPATALGYALVSVIGAIGALFLAVQLVRAVSA